MEAVVGLVVTHLASRFSGTISEIDRGGVVLRSRNTGLERHFPLTGGDFVVSGSRVTLLRPRSGAETNRAPAVARTASGSLSTGPTRARPARASRLFVEGVHDAELVEKIWGDDLRVDAIAVELLEGIDHLESAIEQFEPGPDARLGILVDHLVPGSKEFRIAARLAQPHVLIQGTPYVDVWQAIRPTVLGLSEWPTYQGHPLEGGHLQRLRGAVPGPAVETAARPGAHLRRPGTGVSGGGRIADRLHHRGPEQTRPH